MRTVAAGACHSYAAHRDGRIPAACRPWEIPDARIIDEARPEVDRRSLTHYGPNAFVQRRETSVQSSLRESSFRKLVAARKVADGAPQRSFVLPAVCDALSQHFAR